MASLTEYELVRQQTKSFEIIGCTHTFQMIRGNPVVVIYHIKSGKLYHFSDPDWWVVSMQLAALYRSIKNVKKNEAK